MTISLTSAIRKPIEETKFTSNHQWPLHKVGGWVLDAFSPGFDEKTFTYFHSERRHRVIVTRPPNWVRGVS